MVLTEGKINYNMESWNIGMRRVNKIMEQERANGFRAWATGLHSNLPDILIFDDNLCFPLSKSFDALVRVYEVTNYASPQSYIQQDRVERYINTLLSFRCHKIFVCSYESNIPGGPHVFKQHGIEVQIRNVQD